MTDSAPLEKAFARLNQALLMLETLSGQRFVSDHSLHEVEASLTRLSEDRSKLASDLDDALARANRLEDANREVSRRLVGAMESIRSVLDAHGV